MAKSEVTFHPIISSIQKIALYETKSDFYLVGSNNTESRFRVLRISRREPKELRLHDDKVEYTKTEIHNFLTSISTKNHINNVISAFGIVGFIRFLEGYYIILVTQRTRVAVIGFHTIYKIEYTTMIYIPNDSERSLHPDEARYVKMFQAIDLSSNFYFSYSYDLTHTLQHNMSSPKKIIPNLVDENQIGHEMHTSFREDTQLDFAVRFRPNRRFVWNSHLLSKVEKDLHPDWLIYITHGFIGQSNISVFGRSIYVTLIARRSCKYAGTRFLKRGANFQGDVANEVETEQMAYDSGVSSFTKSNFTSFVQMRGSIPGHWRQDMGKIVAKPAITLDLNDPFAETAGAHFNDLLKRYGSPIVVLNLVKQREKKKQERLLSDEFSGSIKYLNQFLPPEHQIQYKPFDMARKNKSNANVMELLAGIAKSCVSKTGIFQNKRAYYAQKAATIVGKQKTVKNMTYQTGIIRTNCVDCLDRTNTAQFAIGKLVLGYQLCALGVLDTPNLEFDTDCVRMLESLYEDHGDTLALQYGGSQLVHRIKTYRKTAPWTSQGNDIMQTLSRYYSNTFSDAEKQNTINLFLGLFVPEANRPQIWEYPNDYYFHFRSVINFADVRLLTQWWDVAILPVLPLAYDDVEKACAELIQVQHRDLEMIDAYSDYHRPYQLSVLDEVFAYKICNSIRDFMPNCTTNYSPFSIRVRPGRRREEAGKNMNTKNPSLTGLSSTSSTTSSTSTDSSECSDSSEDETSLTNESQMTQSHDSNNTSVAVKFQTLFPSMDQVYGMEISEPKKADMAIYKKYVLTGKKANGTLSNNISLVTFDKLQRKPCFGTDTSRQIKPPTVSQKSIDMYTRYIEIGKNGGFEPSAEDMAKYEKFAKYKY